MNQYAGIAVKLPGELFSDDDYLCIEAAMHLCFALKRQLLTNGHTVPAWVEDGCEEDWGVYFESELNGARYRYMIGIYPEQIGDEVNWVQILYEPTCGFFRSLFGKKPTIGPEDPNPWCH